MCRGEEGVGYGVWEGVEERELGLGGLIMGRGREEERDCEVEARDKELGKLDQRNDVAHT